MTPEERLKRHHQIQKIKDMLEYQVIAVDKEFTAMARQMHQLLLQRKYHRRRLATFHFIRLVSTWAGKCTPVTLDSVTDFCKRFYER